jgi:hypothetical protein
MEVELMKIYLAGAAVMFLVGCDLVEDFNDGMRERVIGPPYRLQRDLERERRELDRLNGSVMVT